MKIKVYLDLNIYSKIHDNHEINTLIKNGKGKIDYYYSPAHIEEIFKAISNNNMNYKEKMITLLDIINEITDAKELLPNINIGSSIKVQFEKTQSCYARVATCDTRDFTHDTSIDKFKEDRANAIQVQENDKSMKNLSSLSYSDIWENELVKSYIDNSNKNMVSIINKQNIQPVIQFLRCHNIDKSISENLIVRKGIFTEIYKKHSDLEFIIEILFRVLTYTGYNRDKDEVTAVSGTHDITHSIYGTYCDYIVTADEKFSKRCKAVYHYLGSKTEVIFCKQKNLYSDLEQFLLTKIKND